MITRRDLVVAAITSCIVSCVAAAVVQQPKRVMGSSVFDWTAMTATPTKIGARRTVFQSPTPTLDELECHITTLNPGASPHAPHKHPDEELIVVKEGTVESMVNNELKRVGAGSVIFQASNQMHSIRNVGHTPATYHVIKWNSPGMKPTE